MAEHLLEVRGVTKVFPGVKALKGIDFTLDAGEIVSFCGCNGAGKSTFCSIIGGLYPQTEGEIILNGKSIRMSSPIEAEAEGIATVHQEPSLVPRLNVVENIFLNNEITNRLGIVDMKKMNQITKETLKRLDFNLDITKLACDLSLIEQEIVTIIRALIKKPKILILDEATAPLNYFEVEHLFEIVRDIAKQGVAILFISHKLVETMSLASRVCVFRDGKKVSDNPISEVDESKIIANMLGKTLDADLGHKGSEPYTTEGRQEILKVENFALDGIFKNYDFSLYKGEILGFAGLISAGVSQMMYCLSGVMQATGGTASYKGETIQFKNPKDAIKKGIGMLTNNKFRDSLAAVHNIRDNEVNASLDAYTSGGLINDAKITRDAKEMAASVGVVAPSIYVGVNTLSGGNAQKVVFCKWMLADLDLLLIDEPTHGVDVKAKVDIYKLMLREKAENKTIMVYSPETKELLDVCDRILIATQEGTIAEVRRNTPEFTEEAILNLIHKAEKRRLEDN